ncbi:MAG TPA: YlxR family protein [Kineosporiaceae bacterium]|nr:YlxR family protein [Kineosporiaceae bacterium]
MLSVAGHAVGQSTPVTRPPQRSVRTCVGCRERADRSVLLRVAAVQVDGNWCVVPDPRHRLPGRGASLHPALGCFELAERRKAFTRALRRGAPLELAPVREFVSVK